MKSFDDLVAQLRAAEGAGFDVSATQAGIVLNRWIKRLAALSKWVREERDLGPAVAGVDTYDLDSDIVDLHDLLVDGGDALEVSPTDFFRLKAGTKWLQGGPPWIAYAARDTADGTKQFSIYPAPESVTTIVGLVSIMPGDLSHNQKPPYPDDMEQALLDGAKSTLYAELDENPGASDYYEQKFVTAAELLRRRANSQVGSGFFQAPVGRY